VTLPAPLSAGEVDLTDPALFADGDPHAVFAHLRARAPVHCHRRPDGSRFWVLSRHADVARGYTDPDAFSSRFGLTIGSCQERPDPSADRMIELMDPPRHTALRRQLNRHFAPASVARLEPGVRNLIRHVVDEAVGAGACDFAADVAARFPLALTLGILGVPRRDWPHLSRLVARSLGTFAPAAPSSAVGLAYAQILDYYQTLVRERRRRPAGGVLDLLIATRIDDAPLTDEEVVLNCLNVMMGGNETSRHGLAGALLALIEHPDQLERLRRDPALVPAAVEEILRWVTPTMHFVRRTTRPVEVRGTPIPEGEVVSLWNLSANRDESVFADPCTFDVGRVPNPHLAFSVGQHFCLGASVARLELRVFVEELLRTGAEVRLAGPVERLRSNFLAGITRLPVAFS
jgi:cytochrome P450